MATPVLLVSDGLVHPSLLARFWLRRALAALPGYRFRRAASLEALVHLPPDSFEVIVLYVHHETLSEAALDRLDDALQRGCGLLALHSASASFKGAPRYYEILGGRFDHHGPIETFVVQPALAEDEVLGDVSAFSVCDELYRHEYDPENREHLYTAVGQEREPVVWTRRWGRGRVCYCSLGHTTSAMRHPSMREIVRRGLAWVSEGADV